MQETKADPVPYIVHEGECARLERVIKRLWVLCIIIFLTLIISNAAWLYYESSFEEVVTTSEVSQSIDTRGGGDTTVTGIGDIYGKDKTDSQEDN